MPPKSQKQRRKMGALCHGKGKRKKGDPTKAEACEILHGKKKKKKNKAKRNK